VAIEERPDIIVEKGESFRCVSAVRMGVLNCLYIPRHVSAGQTDAIFVKMGKIFLRPKIFSLNVKYLSEALFVGRLPSPPTL
jgi:hypothetical protein